MIMIKLRILYCIALVTMLGIMTDVAQVTTIVNYDFNSGSSYGALSPTLAPNVSCSINSTETFTVFTGTASGSNAFTANTTAGNSVVMANSSGKKTRYFQFQLAGSDLSLYHTYKIYFQAIRGGAGATTITLAYSTDGSTYTEFSPTRTSGFGSFSECSYDLSAISVLNVKSTVYFRLLMDGASGSGVFGMDNFQIRATKCITPAAISAGSTKTITCSSPSAVLTGSSSTSGVTYSWTPGGATTSSISVSAAGAYTLNITDPATGCTNTATTSVITNTAAPLSTVAIPTSSLVGYWPFNGNGSDMSGSGNHGTVSGAALAADRFGNSGRAYWFNGSSDYIKVMHSSSVDMNNSADYTIAFWMKAKTVSSDVTPLSKHKSDGSWNGYMFMRNTADMGYCYGTGKFSLYAAAGANGDACADNLVSNDTTNWIFVTGQYQGSANQVKLYINSVLQSDVGARSGNLSNTKDLFFGAHDNISGFFKGYLDDIRFYNRLLSQDEINALYNEANPVNILTCTTSNLTLKAYTPVAGATYSWSPGGATTSGITVNAAGTYTVKVTNPSNGCSSTSTIAVTTNTTPPALSIAAIPTTSLMAYWPFNGNANDVSGNGNNGTVSSASLTADRFGNLGRAYSFNGTTSRIDVPHSSTIDMTNGNDYTMAFWLKTNPGNSFVLPISKTPLGGGWNGYYFIVNSTDAGYCNGVGKFSYYVAAGSNGDACADDLISNDAANWYFITGQYKSSTNQTFLYVNGVLQSDIGSKSGTLSNTAQLSFGACSCGPYQYYNGSLDDIRFYKRILSQAEIEALYNEPNPVSVLTCETPSLTLRGFSPTPGVTYSWSPGGATTSSLSITAAGTYSLKVTNPVNGCVTSSSITITKKLCAEADISHYRSDSIGGNVNLLITGGTPPYNIAWNGIKLPTPALAYQDMKSSFPGVTVDSLLFGGYVDSLRQSKTFGNLTPGTYSVTVYDQLNDSIIVNVVIDIDNSNKFFVYGSTVNTCVIPAETINGIKNYYGQGQCIIQNGSYASNSHVAANLTSITLSQDNELNFSVPKNTDLISVGFQIKKEEINGGTTDIDQNTAFRFNGNGTFDVMYQSVSVYNAAFSSGDKFTIKTNSVTGKIAYFKNNSQLLVKNSAPFTHDMGYLTKIVFGNAGGAVNNLRLSTPIKLILELNLLRIRNVSGTVKDVTCSNPCSGMINASGSNMLFPYPQQYVLTGGNLSTPVTIGVIPFPFRQQNNVTFNGLCAGTYTVTYYSSDRLFYFIPIPTPPGWTPPPVLTGTASNTFEVAYMPDWINYSPNVTVNATDRSLTKTSGLSQAYTWDAGASSLNILKASANGWVEWTTSASGAVNGIGLSHLDADNDINTINYGVGFIELAKFYILTNNQRIAYAISNTSNVRGNYAVNAIFRLEKNALANTITFKINNAPIIVIPISSQDLILDASMQFLNGVIKKPRVSFGCVAQDYFAELKKEYDAGFHEAQFQILKFKYTEEYNTDNLNYKIYNFKRQLVLSSPSVVVKKEGINKYSMSFSGLIPSGIYYLEVKNGKGEQMVLKFKL